MRLTRQNPMKSKPGILKKLARDVWATGKSISATARICDLPVGTVKTWRSRGQWRRHATTASADEKGANETTHRGLSWRHMPGRPGSKKLTFAAFRRGMWPPREWRVPAHLTGGELLMVLQERACMNERKGGRK